MRYPSCPALELLLTLLDLYRTASTVTAPESSRRQPTRRQQKPLHRGNPSLRSFGWIVRNETMRFHALWRPRTENLGETFRAPFEAFKSEPLDSGSLPYWRTGRGRRLSFRCIRLLVSSSGPKPVCSSPSCRLSRILNEVIPRELPHVALYNRIRRLLFTRSPPTHLIVAPLIRVISFSALLLLLHTTSHLTTPTSSTFYYSISRQYCDHGAAAALK